MKDKRFKSYVRRNQLLKTLGFRSYKSYLESDLWKKIRAKQLKKNGRCFSCWEPATQVHHGRYTPANLLGHNDDELYSVCARHHATSEFAADGTKLSLKEATIKLKRKAKWFKADYLGYLPKTIDDEYRERLEREP